MWLAALAGDSHKAGGSGCRGMVVSGALLADGLERHRVLLVLGGREQVLRRLDVLADRLLVPQRVIGLDGLVGDGDALVAQVVRHGSHSWRAARNTSEAGVDNSRVNVPCAL